jgi:peptidoglycan/LPS O-acetylase OafA/YrhL
MQPNNFGALRLLFAVLVILSHSPELVDGNRSREILTRIFGTLSFGELAVDGFFLISGYLITKSFEHSRSAGSYLLKRGLRIYPGYVVAYLLCVFALGPFVGGRIADLSGARVLMEMAGLMAPGMQGVFPGTPYPALNGSMWTIAYEFRCYLLVIVVGAAGLLSRRGIIAGIAAAALALTAERFKFWIPLEALVGAPDITIRFVGIFGCGALYYLYRDRVRYDWKFASVAGLALLPLMFSMRLAEAAVAILGGYILFWFAFNVRSERLSTIGADVDISYGVYLYAWPVQKILTWWYPKISPWLLFAVATVVASGLAYVSWHLIEKPLLNLKTASFRKRLIAHPPD